MNNVLEPFVTIATAIVGVAILAVIVSRNADTANVLQAAGGAFGTAINAATAPVTGGIGVNLGNFAVPHY